MSWGRGITFLICVGLAGSAGCTHCLVWHRGRGPGSVTSPPARALSTDPATRTSSLNQWQPDPEWQPTPKQQTPPSLAPWRPTPPPGSVTSPPARALSTDPATRTSSLDEQPESQIDAIRRYLATIPTERGISPESIPAEPVSGTDSPSDTDVATGSVLSAEPVSGMDAADVMGDTDVATGSAGGGGESSLLSKALPGVLTALGWSTPPSIAAIMALRIGLAIWRKRKSTRHGRSLNDDYAHQLNELFALSGRTSDQDATLGREYDRELEEATTGTGDVAKWASALRRKVTRKFFRIHGAQPSPAEPIT